MGGDRPPEALFEAVLQCAKTTTDRFVVLAIDPYCSQLSKTAPSNIEFIHAQEAIGMDESPLLAVRRKRQSTLAAGMRLLKLGELDAFLSTGNTGALVATALLHLKMLPGIERPALLVSMPTAKGEVVVLDVGANISPKPHHFVSYGQLGSLFRQCYHDFAAPKIGLLNIGSEQQKGSKELKESFQLLQNTFKDRFLGNIEGREVFQGKVDVLVTDGFTGNIFLKASEGMSHFLVDYLADRFQAPEIVSHLNRKFSYAEHPGALLCGVEGIVVKCHGFSDRTALINGINGAIDLARHQVIQRMKAELIT